MIISRLKLRNWRNFRELDTKLSDRVFIVGPNAAGKSNLLDALRFLRDIAKPGGGLQAAIRERGGLSKIRCLAARSQPDVELEVEISNGGGQIYRYELGISQQPRGNRQPIIKFERAWVDGKKVLERPDPQDRSDPELRTQTHLEQISANAQFRATARFLESLRYLHLVPQLLRHPQSFQGPAMNEDPFGRAFLEQVAKTQEKTLNSRLGKIEKALQIAVPQLKNLALVRDQVGTPHLQAVYEHWRPQGARQWEDQFSDGTLRLIGLFWSLLDGNSPLLLEEPEISLNPAIVELLPEIFHQLTRRRGVQIFVTTHSAELLSGKGIGAEEILLLLPRAEGTQVQLGTSIPGIRDALKVGMSPADVVLPQTAPNNLSQLTLSFE